LKLPHREKQASYAVVVPAYYFIISYPSRLIKVQEEQNAQNWKNAD
jgi:hypothetical protein